MSQPLVRHLEDGLFHARNTERSWIAARDAATTIEDFDAMARLADVAAVAVERASAEVERERRRMRDAGHSTTIER